MLDESQSKLDKITSDQMETFLETNANEKLNKLINKPANMENIKPVATVIGSPVDEPYEPDYDEFGSYLESVTNLSENYEITIDYEIPEIYASDPDDAYPAEGEFEIEYCGSGRGQFGEGYLIDIKKYYTEFEVDGMPIKGKFTLKDFLKKECHATFEFLFSETDSINICYRCRLLDYKLV